VGAQATSGKATGSPLKRPGRNLAIAPRYLAVDLASHASGVIVRWRAQKKKSREGTRPARAGEVASAASRHVCRRARALCRRR
jgi:hypothetical protein